MRKLNLKKSNNFSLLSKKKTCKRFMITLCLLLFFNSLTAQWSLTGNSGTKDGTNFIGTTDNVPFNIRVNNQKAGRIELASPYSTFYGYQSGNANTTGYNNTANGYQAL